MIVQEAAPGTAPQLVFSGLDSSVAGDIEAAFAKAAHVAKIDFVVNRVSANSMEPRAALGVYDESDDRYTLYASLQSPHQMRSHLAENIFKLPESRFRIVAPDVGGAFGMKGAPMPELGLVLFAALITGATVTDTIADWTDADEVITAIFTAATTIVGSTGSLRATRWVMLITLPNDESTTSAPCSWATRATAKAIDASERTPVTRIRLPSRITRVLR